MPENPAFQSFQVLSKLRLKLSIARAFGQDLRLGLIVQVCRSWLVLSCRLWRVLSSNNQTRSYLIGLTGLLSADWWFSVVLENEVSRMLTSCSLFGAHQTAVNCSTRFFLHVRCDLGCLARREILPLEPEIVHRSRRSFSRIFKGRP